MADEVEINIRANVADLNTAMQGAANTTTNAFGQMKSSASTFADALRAAGGDVRKITPEMLGLAEGSAAAGTGFVAVADAATAAAAPVNAIKFNTNQAAREFRALFDELSSGRTRMVPGTLAIIAQRVFGMQPAALAATAAVGLLVFGLYELASAAAKAEHELEGIEGRMTLLGRGAQAGVSGIESSVTGLEHQFDIGGTAARAYVLAINSIPVATDATRASLLQLAPAWAKLQDQDPAKSTEAWVKAFSGGPDALSKFADSLDLLTPAQVAAMAQAKSNNDAMAAQSIVLEALENRLDPTTTKLRNMATTTEALAGGWRHAAVELQKGTLPSLLAPAATPPSAQAADPAAVEAQKIADQYNATKIKQGTILRDIDILTAKVASDQAAAERGATSAAAQQIKDQSALDEALRARVKVENDLAQPLVDAARLRVSQIQAVEKSGSTKEISDEIAVWDQVIATAKSKGLQSVDAERARNELLAQLHRAQGVEENKIGRDLIQDTKTMIAEKQAVENQTRLQQLTIARDTWAQLLQGDKLTKDQRVAVQKEYYDAVNAVNTANQSIVTGIRQDNLKTDIAINKLQLEAKKADLQSEVTATTMTAQQRLAILQKLTQDIAADDVKLLQIEQSNYDVGTKEYNDYANRIRLIHAQLTVDLAKDGAQMVKDTKKDALEQALAWRDAANQAGQAFSSFTQDVFSRQHTLVQSLQLLTSQWLQNEIAADMKYYAMKALYSALGLQDDVKNLRGGVLATLLSEQQKTESTVTGAAERQAAESAGSSGGLLSVVENAVKWIATEAAKTFAGVFAFFSPTLGPAAAGPAAASEAAVLAATGPMMAFETGAWEIPGNMAAYLHRGEMVVPANYASGMRAAMNGGEGDGGEGGIHIHIEGAMDGMDVMRTLTRHKTAIARMLRTEQQRNMGARPKFGGS